MILVDTDILICHLRGVGVARQWLLDTCESHMTLAVSAVTVTEIAGGMRSSERREVWRLLDALQFEPIDELVSRQAGEFMRSYRRSHGGISLGDYLIAATAKIRGFELATLNFRHYPMFKGLKPPFAPAR